MDAVTLSGLRLLKAIGIATDAKAMGGNNMKQSWNPDRESGDVSHENTWRLPFVGDVEYWVRDVRKPAEASVRMPASLKKKLIVDMIEVGYQTLDTMASISIFFSDSLTFRPCAATWVGSRSSL